MPATKTSGSSNRRWGYACKACRRLSGRVVEDDLVDQPLDRREVVRVNLVVIWRQPEVPFLQRRLRGVARERRSLTGEVVVRVVDGYRHRGPVDERVAEVRVVQQEDGGEDRCHGACN